MLKSHLKKFAQPFNICTSIQWKQPLDVMRLDYGCGWMWMIGLPKCCETETLESLFIFPRVTRNGSVS